MLCGINILNESKSKMVSALTSMDYCGTRKMN